MFLNKKIQDCKNFKLFLKCIRKYNTIPIKIPMGYSWKHDRRVLKFIEKY